jgi:phosphohistidine swiveling domain-containing protein
MFGESYEDAPDHYLFSRLLSASNNTIPEKRHGYENTPEFKNVVAFMQAREETKFLFSRALHTFIKRLKVMLMEAGISPQSAAKRMWSELPMLLKVGDPTPSSQRPCAELPMYLPEVIVPGNTCMTVVVLGEAAATYVTRASIRAPIQVLNHPDDQVDVRGKIVLIPYADPGYDFLFHSGIAGIISKVGGPASHMCVRAIELQVPACIGCGERLYASLAASETVLLDCESRQVIALS